MWILLRENKQRSHKNYFITFINDFSRYCYICLLHEKSQSVDALELFINDVERQLDRKVKIIKSARGNEYYERYIENGECHVHLLSS